jgi:hypothetical protein
MVVPEDVFEARSPRDVNVWVYGVIDVPLTVIGSLLAS